MRGKHLALHLERWFIKQTSLITSFVVFSANIQCSELSFFDSLTVQIPLKSWRHRIWMVALMLNQFVASNWTNKKQFFIRDAFFDNLVICVFAFHRNRATYISYLGEYFISQIPFPVPIRMRMVLDSFCVLQNIYLWKWYTDHFYDGR